MLISDDFSQESRKSKGREKVTSVHALLEELNFGPLRLFSGFCGETVALVDIFGHI